MRIGIVGSGGMGTTHAAAWSRTPATIAGFVSKTPESCADLARQYGAQIYLDLSAMLEDVDVVDICAPTHWHRDMVLQAAEAGKDIVCEKPLARTVAQGQEMIAACRQAGVRLLVAHVVRFFPEYSLARAQVQSGQIGEPAVIRLTRGTFQPRKAEDNWFLDFELSGGMMLDLMIHDFDYARWVAGEVQQVYAKKISSSHPEAARQVSGGIDHGLAILTHRSGTISHVEGSWAYPPPLFRTRLEIATSNGWIQFDSGQTASIGLHLRGAAQPPVGTEKAPDVPLPRSPLLEDPFTTEIKAFYECLVQGTPPPVSGADGLAALQIALAAIESADSGQPVSIEPLPEVSAQEVTQ